MVNDHKKYELFGKTLIEKLALNTPFKITLPLENNACFLYMLEGDMHYKLDDEQVDFKAKDSVLLNCRNFEKELCDTNSNQNNKLVIIHFHPDILKKIYDRGLPSLLQMPRNLVSNKSNEKIKNDFLIQKYIEGLLFYFENPILVNEDILILKLKEIILLLSQTRNAEAIQVILSQLFSPTTYTFKQIIEAHLFSQLTIEELAQHTNLSVSSFKREFAKLYSDTPANYIKTKRLEKAAEMLLVSTNRISDIAFDCGFNDLANFSKSFFDKYNTSPSNYRLNQIAK
jgi:AraC-like DNA-binding protein